MKKIHRFICKFDSGKDEGAIAEAQVVKQIHSVLKLKEGEEVGLFDGAGHEVLARITEISKNGLRYEVVQRHEQQKKQGTVTLYCAVLKKENFEIVVQKATEVGIDKIVPIVTKRTVKLGLRMDRLQRIAEEASEQCGRSIVPIVSYPKELHEAVQIAKDNDLNLFCDMAGEDFARSEKEKTVGVFVGPEGGWSEEELGFVENFSHFKRVSLGGTTLRAETAAIIASYLACK